MRQFILAILPYFSMGFPANWRMARRAYPQLWYCWPRWSGRGHRRIFNARIKICGFLTGHEPSSTEWGYGGGEFADGNCRWCDFSISIPLQESIWDNPMRQDLAAMILQRLVKH